MTVNAKSDDTCSKVTDSSCYLSHIKWHDMMVDAKSDDTWSKPCDLMEKREKKVMILPYIDCSYHIWKYHGTVHSSAI